MSGLEQSSGTGKAPRVTSDGTARSRLQRLRTSFSLTEMHPGQMFGGALLLALPIALLAYFGQGWIATSVKAEIRKSLLGILDAATAGVELWLEVTQEASRRVASSAAVVDQAEETLAACRARAHCNGDELARLLAPIQEPLGPRSFLVDANERLVIPLFASELPKSAHARILDALASHTVGGGPIFLPPFFLTQEEPWSGFVTRVGKSDRGPLLLTEVSGMSLTRSLVAARRGHTGETYAVDGHGRMISESRFLEDLRAIGLLRPVDATSVLLLDIRNPGIDLTAGARTSELRAKQPLTLPAAALEQHRSGVEVDGYRDYRGVPVVGAWRWLPRYGFGVITESDQVEAFTALRGLRELFFSVIGILACVAAGMGVATFMARRNRLRARVALKQAERLGQYKIERKLGEGGMGAVYLATHALLRRPTAIKVVRPERATDEALARFEREVRATSELVHPNTVSIFDYGRAEDGTFFYAMELLDGLDLEALVSEYGPQPEARVVSVLTQVCGSLAEAHEKGMVHRDIKPSNIFLCRQGGLLDFVKVLDFGIVKDDLSDKTRITRSSTVIGTPEYMSPEMFDRAASVSAQADIYSLGAVAYFLLTARTVFDAHSMAEVCSAHLTEEPLPPSQRVGRPISRDLEEVVLACLAKKPGARPRGARALRALLQGLSGLEPWTEQDAVNFWAHVGPQEPRPPRAESSAAASGEVYAGRAH